MGILLHQLADAANEFTIRTMIRKFHPDAVTAAELGISKRRNVAVEIMAANQTFPHAQQNAVLRALEGLCDRLDNLSAELCDGMDNRGVQLTCTSINEKV
jgi:hypothetical protein